jgi:hypothetical protein
MWLSSYCTLMNLVMAFLAYCRCITTVLYACMGCMIQQPVSVHLVYSTFCTMVGVALPYQVHVHAAWYGSFCTPGVQYCLYHHWCFLTTISYACTTVHASWYGMVGASLPYRMHVHAAWYGSFRTPAVQYLLYHTAGTMIQRCSLRIHCGVTFVCFAANSYNSLLLILGECSANCCFVMSVIWLIAP